MTATGAEIVEIFLELPPGDIAYLKFILESYEGVGVMRTIDRTKAVVVLMIAADFLDDARAILDSLRAEVSWCEIDRPDEPWE
jgi:hypothetical protein